jgi:hypothetical protein
MLSAVGAQQQAAGPGLMPPSKEVPPTVQALDGELCGLMGHPDIDEALLTARPN